MKRLIINTQFPSAVHKLLAHYQLIEENWQARAALSTIVYNYPNDALSQELAFWFALATGCGLVSDYRLERGA